MGTKSLIALLVAVLGAGFVVGRMTADSPQRPRRTGARTDIEIDEPVRRASAAHEPETDSPAVEPNDAQSALAKRLGETPSADAVADTASRAAEIRRQALQTAELAEVIAAGQVATEIERERAFMADKERAGAMALLRGLDEKPARLFELVTDQPRFAKLFERHTDAGAIRGETPRKGELIRDGTTLTFDPGRSVWRSRDLESVPNQKFPKDLVIEGRGMDATLVTVDEISTDDEIHSLTFRDCTVDCGNDYLTDLRSRNPVTIRMIRCRVIRFDMGAGGSVMLAARSAAFYASGCRFEAGFGRSPGSGNLFRVRSGLLVRIEDSTFVGPFRSVYDTNTAATYVFERCRFEQQKVPLDSPPAGVRFIDCTSTPPPAETRRESKPLTAINPNWEQASPRSGPPK